MSVLISLLIVMVIIRHNDRHCVFDSVIREIIVMKLQRSELLFFDGTVLTEKFCVGVPLNIQYIYLCIRLSIVNLSIYVYVKLLQVPNPFLH